MKEKIKNGEIVLGTSYPVPHPLISGILGTLPVDFAWLDTEHQPHATETLSTLPVLLRQHGVAPLIRVAWNDPALIKKAYDIGAVAVMVPQVETAEEAAQAVQYAKYPPEGNRGVAPMWPRIAGADFNQVVKTANDETVLILQIESVKAFENVDEIKEVSGIDALFLGPMDMSASVGKIGETNSSEVQDIVKALPQKLEGCGIVASTLTGAVEDTQQKIDWGYKVISVGNMLTYGAQIVQENMDTLRASS